MEDIGWQVYLGLVALLAGSAFFSASETAFATVNTIRLKNYADAGNKKAALALKIAEMYEKTLSSILIGNNLVNIAISSIVAVLFTTWMGSAGTWVSTAVVTVVVLIFGEILPKTFAKEHSEKVALRVCGVLLAIITLMTPVSFLFIKMQHGFINLFKSERKQPSVTEEELKYIIETIENEGVLGKEESSLVQSALDFDETPAEKIAIPRVDMVCVDLEDSIDEILGKIVPEHYSRIPVYEHSVDKIVGVLYLRDMFDEMVQHGKEALDVRRLMHPCVFVHRSMKIPAVLNVLQKQNQHMAIVTDDYGGTYGLVTMEDILEELVGEIYDESDEIPEGVTRVNEACFETAGEVDVDDLFEEIGYTPPDFDCDYHSVSGWVLEELEHIPEPMESFVRGRLKVTVLQVEEQRIGRVRLELLPEQADED
ncbi:MAG: hemolysin family protein [Oscillospiraceae bacterium]|nr:hemolysin family protein [Oscillospiraceae bacterium]